MIRSDLEIRRSVLEALSSASDLDAVGITVDVVDGIAYLHGTVPNYAEKRRATELANQVKDVLNVVNDLQATRPEGRADHGITYDVLAALKGDPWLDPSRIGVRTACGVVELSGSVDSPEHRVAAERVARAVPGVVGVENRLVVRPAATLDDREISDTVMALVASDPRIDARNIAADVQGGTVHLRGTVTTTGERLLAAHLARGAPGVREVVDDLKVVGRG